MNESDANIDIKLTLMHMYTAKETTKEPISEQK